MVRGRVIASTRLDSSCGFENNLRLQKKNNLPKLQKKSPLWQHTLQPDKQISWNQVTFWGTAKVQGWFDIFQPPHFNRGNYTDHTLGLGRCSAIPYFHRTQIETACKSRCSPNMGATIGFVSATNPANVIKASSPRPHPSLSIHLPSTEPGFLTAPKKHCKSEKLPWTPFCPWWKSWSWGWTWTFLRSVVGSMNFIHHRSEPLFV